MVGGRRLEGKETKDRDYTPNPHYLLNPQGVQTEHCVKGFQIFSCRPPRGIQMIREVVGEALESPWLQESWPFLLMVFSQVTQGPRLSQHVRMCIPVTKKSLLLCHCTARAAQPGDDRLMFGNQLSGLHPGSAIS